MTSSTVTVTSSSPDQDIVSSSVTVEQEAVNSNEGNGFDPAKRCKSKTDSSGCLLKKDGHTDSSTDQKKCKTCAKSSASCCCERNPHFPAGYSSVSQEKLFSDAGLYDTSNRDVNPTVGSSLASTSGIGMPDSLASLQMLCFRRSHAGYGYTHFDAKVRALHSRELL